MTNENITPSEVTDNVGDERGDAFRGIPVAPRLRAIGLPCIASPDTMSSSNTQHLGTENNRFIDASGS